MEQKNVLLEKEKVGKRGLTPLALVTTVLLVASLVLNLFLFIQIWNTRASTAATKSQFSVLEKERDEAVSRAEGLRADIVSYDAMAKRLEFEKARAARAEGQLKELSDKGEAK